MLGGPYQSRVIVVFGARITSSGVGSVRVFVQSGSGWAEEGLLLAPAGAAGDFFGASLRGTRFYPRRLDASFVYAGFDTVGDLSLNGDAGIADGVARDAAGRVLARGTSTCLLYDN